MRKGIMSILSLSGRGKGSGKKKTKNMELAEQSAAKNQPAEQLKAEARAQEKPFVQTIQVPKPNTPVKNTKRKHMMLGRSRRRQEEKK